MRRIVPQIEAHRALSQLAVRAALVYVPLRIIVSVYSLKQGPTATLTLDYPPGIVMLVALLGFIDTRARGERLFWANLGYGIPVIIATFAAVATIGECMIALLP